VRPREKVSRDNANDNSVLVSVTVPAKCEVKSAPSEAEAREPDMKRPSPASSIDPKNGVSERAEVLTSPASAWDNPGDRVAAVTLCSGDEAEGMSADDEADWE